VIEPRSCVALSFVHSVPSCRPKGTLVSHLFPLVPAPHSQQQTKEIEDKLAAVTIDAAHVDILAAEFDLSTAEAERKLREACGCVETALKNLLNEDVVRYEKERKEKTMPYTADPPMWNDFGRGGEVRLLR